MQLEDVEGHGGKLSSWAQQQRRWQPGDEMGAPCMP